MINNGENLSSLQNQFAIASSVFETVNQTIGPILKY